MARSLVDEFLEEDCTDLEARLIREAAAGSTLRYLQGDPALFTVKVLGGERLGRLLERAREKRYDEVPLPVGEYDATPTGLV